MLSPAAAASDQDHHQIQQQQKYNNNKGVSSNQFLPVTKSLKLPYPVARMSPPSDDDSTYSSTLEGGDDAASINSSNPSAFLQHLQHLQQQSSSSNSPLQSPTSISSATITLSSSPINPLLDRSFSHPQLLSMNSQRAHGMPPPDDLSISSSSSSTSVHGITTSKAHRRGNTGVMASSSISSSTSSAGRKNSMPLIADGKTGGLPTNPFPPAIFSATPTNHFIASNPLQSRIAAESAASESSLASQTIKRLWDANIGFSNGLELRVLGVPQQNARSRVETQIKICLQLVTETGDKVTHWPHLKLPENLITRDKLKRGKTSDQLFGVPTGQVLSLEAKVICASDPQRVVSICHNCMQRERKRIKKRTDIAEEDAEETNPADEQERVLLFSCNSTVEFGSGDAILPTRIACYSRHHNERLGFCIYLAARDASRQVIATGVSPPILITDDHKSTKVKTTKRTRDEAFAVDPSTVLPPMAATLAPPMDNVLTTPAHAQMPALNPAMSQSSFENMEFSGVIKEELFSASASPMDSSRRSPDNAVIAAALMGDVSATANFPPLFNGFLSGGALGSQNALSTVENALGLYDALMMEHNNSSSSNSNDITRPAKRRQHSTTPLLQSLGEPGEMGMQSPLSDTGVLLAALTNTNLSSPFQNGTVVSNPVINRIIPAEGPMQGGIEVTLLGSGFYDGMTVLFGDVAAPKAQVWGGSTIICVLPPSGVPGPVAVTLREHPMMAFTPQGASELAIFTYKDDNERALMELALQVVGLHMTGKLEDARSIAMRIVSDTANSENTSGLGHTSTERSSGGSMNMMMHQLAAQFGLHGSHRDGPLRKSDLERVIASILLSIKFDESLLDGSNGVSLRHIVNLPRKGSLHSMLHLACMSGMSSVVKVLVSLGADLDARDLYGFTPLMFAAWKGDVAVMCELVNAGASTHLSSKCGMTWARLAVKYGKVTPADVVEVVEVEDDDADEGVDVEDDDDEVEPEVEEEVEELEGTVPYGGYIGLTRASPVAEADIPDAVPVVAIGAPVSIQQQQQQQQQSHSITKPNLPNLFSRFTPDSFFSAVMSATSGKPDTKSPTTTTASKVSGQLLDSIFDAANADMKDLAGAHHDDTLLSGKDHHQSITWLSAFASPFVNTMPTILAIPAHIPGLMELGAWFGYEPTAGSKTNMMTKSNSTDTLAEALVLKAALSQLNGDLIADDNKSTYIKSNPTSPLLLPISTDVLSTTTTVTSPTTTTITTTTMTTTSSSAASSLTTTTANITSVLSDLIPLPAPLVGRSFDADEVDVYDEDFACDCEAMATGKGYHSESCREVKFLVALREKKLRRDRALIMFWIPLLLLMLGLALFRLVVSNEEMDSLLEKAVSVHLDVLRHLRDAIHGINGRGATGTNMLMW